MGGLHCAKQSYNLLSFVSYSSIIQHIYQLIFNAEINYIIGLLISDVCYNHTLHIVDNNHCILYL